jgi:hypothetical protein
MRDQSKRIVSGFKINLNIDNTIERRPPTTVAAPDARQKRRFHADLPHD